MGCSSELGNYFDDEAAGHPSAADDQDIDPGPARRNSGQGTRWHQAASVSAGRAPHTGPHRAPQRRRTAAHTPMARCTGNSPICTSSSWMRPTRSRQEASPCVFAYLVRRDGAWQRVEGGVPGRDERIRSVPEGLPEARPEPSSSRGLLMATRGEEPGAWVGDQLQGGDPGAQHLLALRRRNVQLWQQNTSTRKLTEEMLDGVFLRARELLR
jgi:hypothetical protein